MKLHLYVAKSKVLQSSSSLVLDKILIPEDEHENEDEDEKNQIELHAYALRPKPFIIEHPVSRIHYPVSRIQHPITSNRLASRLDNLLSKCRTYA